MRREPIIIMLAIAVGLLLPTAIVIVMVITSMDAIDVLVQAILLFSMLPIIGLAIYMWGTGRGASFIAGYNTASQAERDRYDSERLARFVGKLLLVSMLPMLLATESVFLTDSMWPFTILFAASMALIIGGMVYANTGGRFLRDDAGPMPATTPGGRAFNRRTIYTLVITTAIVIISVALIMALITSASSIDVELRDQTLHVKAPTVNVTIDYEDIEDIELRDDLNLGRRVGGFGGSKISSGKFRNAEFGNYVLASHNNVPMHIVVHHSGKVLVFNLETTDLTREFHDELVGHVPPTA